MTNHEAIRASLALAVSGTLDAEEMRRVEQHARECQGCRRELEILGLYARGLGQLPQPVVPTDLLARTQARVLRERAGAAERSRDAVLIGVLSVSSFASSVVTWFAVRWLTGGVLEFFGTNWVTPIPWFFASAAVAWMTAATAAVALGRREVRRAYESV